jgi:hypothetical protein
MNFGMDPTAHNAFPCFGCTDWRRDRLLQKLGLLYLALERGEKPRIPPRAELLKGCCRTVMESGVDDGVTFMIEPGTTVAG